MSTFKLQVTETGNKSAKYLYQVIDENGNIVSERRSNREYVACTANGEFYFGRLDLIGKGGHGSSLKDAYLVLSSPQKRYRDILLNWTPSFRREWQESNPYEKWLEHATKWAIDRKQDLDAIAYK